MYFSPSSYNVHHKRGTQICTRTLKFREQNQKFNEQKQKFNEQKQKFNKQKQKFT